MLRTDTFIAGPLVNNSLRCTYLARGGKANQVALVDHNRCYWMEGLLRGYLYLKKPTSVETALTNFLSTPSKFHVTPATRSDLKHGCAQLNRFRSKPTSVFILTFFDYFTVCVCCCCAHPCLSSLPCPPHPTPPPSEKPMSHPTLPHPHCTRASLYLFNCKCHILSRWATCRRGSVTQTNDQLQSRQ